MLKPAFPTLRFDGFTLDLRRGCLFGRDGQELKLRPKSFEALRYLADNSGRLIGKEELIESLWPGTAVTDDSLVQCLMDVRRALGDEDQRLIRTVPRRGYILQVAVTVSQTAPDDAVVAVASEQAAAPPRGSRRLSPRATAAIVCAVAALVVLSSVSNRLRVFTETPMPGQIRSIAVLPLENLSRDPAEGFFADGMTESLTATLAQIRALNVMSRASMMSYKDTSKTPREIARELDVDAVLEGSVQRSGGRVRLTAKLVPATADAPLWAREYERDGSDVLRLEREIARAIAEQIRIDLTADEHRRLASARAIDPAAFEAYLQGEHHSSIGDDRGWRQAIAYFNQAIQYAPDYAAAYGGLANAWYYRGTYGGNFKEVEAAARAAAMKAIALDDQVAQPHVSLGIIKHYYDWDWAGAEREFLGALSLEPGRVVARLSYGHLLMHLGRHEEAIRQGEIAVQLDPLSSPTQASLGRFLYRARRYDEAVQRLTRAVELEPRSLGANYRLGDVLAQMGRYQDALTAFERLGAPLPGDFRAGVARVYALMGNRTKARALIGGVKANADALAAVHVALGDHDEAFRILDKAVSEHQNVVAIMVDPPLDPLHSDARWSALLKRMNLPGESFLQRAAFTAQ